MRQITDPFDSACRAQTLVVLLPPAEARPEDFLTQGFVAAVRERGIPVDLALADMTYQHLMDKTGVSTLHEQVVLPARAAGYDQIWLVGISLGAFHALHYAAEHAHHLAGVHLLAPYPGTADVLAEIRAAGGPTAWADMPPREPRDERVWWRWLCREAQADQWTTPVYLSTGSEDRFARGQRMMADLLPAAQVHMVPGGHAWPVWTMLWQQWLDHGPLVAPIAVAQPGTESG